VRRNETPGPIWTKFCMVVDISDVIICTNFGDHRLRGGGGSNFPLPRRLSSSPLQHSRTTVRVCDTSLSYCRATRATRCVLSIVSYAMVDAQCDKLVAVAKRTKLSMLMDVDEISDSREFGTKFQSEVSVSLVKAQLYSLLCDVITDWDTGEDFN